MPQVFCNGETAYFPDTEFQVFGITQVHKHQRWHRAVDGAAIEMETGGHQPRLDNGEPVVVFENPENSAFDVIP